MTAERIIGTVKSHKVRIMKLGPGTLAALCHICPDCGAAQGVRCVTASGKPREFVHSKRMDVAHAAYYRKAAAT